MSVSAVVLVDADEAGPAAAMRYVGALAGSAVAAAAGIAALAVMERGCDEEGVRPGDQRARRRVEPVEVLHRDGRHPGLVHRVDFALLDVLRAVAEALRDPDGEAAGIRCRDRAVDAVASARVQLDPEQPDFGTQGDRAVQRVAAVRKRGDPQ